MIYIGKDDVVQNLFTGERLWPTSRKIKSMAGNTKNKEDWAKYFDDNIYTPTKTNKQKMEVFNAIWETARLLGKEDFRQKVIELRNELYDSLPTGEVDAFELLTVVKNHIKEIDKITKP